MNEIATLDKRELTAADVRAQVNLIQEVMKAVMLKDTHYGVIPGCQKPSLWKPGAEKLLVTFRIATEAFVEDLSVPGEARYRVTRKATAINGGAFLGSSVGECSSNEEKYRWRGAVCEAEFDQTPENRRRLKFKRDGGSFPQVQTNAADMANTILKMADKRAYVALALQVTAASDIFTQDIEDLPPELAESIAGAEEKKAPINEPKETAAAPAPGGAGMVNEAQRKRFYAKWKGSGKTEDAVRAHLTSVLGTDDSRMIPVGKVYEDLCAWADAK